MQFLADRVTEQETFKKSLFHRVYASRNKPENKIAAANAITILNRARVVFSCLDLSGIQIPDADLGYALMYGVNLANANLRRVSLNQAYLSEANLSKSNMEGISLGQLPILKDKKEIKAVCYSQDGQYLATACEYEVVIWDARDLREIKRLRGHTHIVLSVAFSPNSEILASGGCDHEARLWDVNSGQLIYMLKRVGYSDQPGITYYGEQYRRDIYTVNFSPDGKIFAHGGISNCVNLWDVKTAQFIDKPLMIDNYDVVGYSDGYADVKSITFSPDGRYLAGYLGGLMLWEVETKKLIAELKEHQSDGSLCDINSIAFNPDGKYLASGGKDKTVKIWDIQARMSSITLNRHTGPVNSVAFNHDGKILASGSSDMTIKLWEVKTWQLLANYQGHTSSINSVAFSFDGKYLASGSNDSTVRLWEVQTNVSMKNTIGHTSSVNSLVISPDGKLVASGSSDHSIRLWNISTGEEISRLLAGYDSVSCVAFSSDGKYLASSEDDSIIVWEVATGKRVDNFLPIVHRGDIKGIAFTPDGKYLASSGEEDVKLWKLKTRKQKGKPLQEKGIRYINSIVFSPNGMLLAIASEWGVTVWEVKSWRRLPINWNEGGGTKTHCIAFSADGKYLAGGGSYDIKMWSLEIPIKKLFKGHNADVNTVIFTSTGDYLYSGSQDCTIRFWSVATQECLRIYKDVFPINCIRLTTDGEYLVIGNSAGAIGWWHCRSRSQQLDYKLVKYSGNLCLIANKLNLNDVSGLSAKNYQLLNQLGADANLAKPVTPVCSNEKAINWVPQRELPISPIKSTPTTHQAEFFKPIGRSEFTGFQQNKTDTSFISQQKNMPNKPPMRHGRPKAESKSPRSCALSLRSNRAASSRLKNMLRELAM